MTYVYVVHIIESNHNTSTNYFGSQNLLKEFLFSDWDLDGQLIISYEDIPPWIYRVID